MIIESFAWFVLILFINAFIAIFIDDPKSTYVEAMAFVLIIEIIAILIAAAIFIFGWAVQYLFINQELTK